MKLQRTASIKLDIDENSKAILLNTISAFTDAYNLCASIGWNNKISNGIKLHHLTYAQMRETLPAQLAVSARMLAVESLKSVFAKSRKKKNNLTSCPKSKRMSIRFDSRSYSLWIDKKEVSLLTTNGRIKLPIKLNKHFEKFRTWKYTSATLKFKKNKFFLNVSFEKDIEDPKKNGKLIGIDRGIKKLAVTSDNRFFLGGETRRVSQRYQRLRKKLQKAGTKSAKRHLRKLSGREKRFKADVNHRISKQIIEGLNSGDIIVLESLSGIRNKRLRKKQRKELNSWSFYQLEQFLTYKALAKGIHVEHVDARYTSQRCSECGDIKRSNRKSQSGFKCTKCGFRLNADLNAARNICLKHLDAKDWEVPGRSGYPDRVGVNQPNEPSAQCLSL